MKRRVACFFLLLLSACTGTQEAGNPILVIVGYEDEGGKVALIEDSFGARGATRERFTFLPESVRTLPAPPVAYDLTDRAGIRDELVVLSRSPSTQTETGAAYLTFFSLARIDPEEPAAFERTRQFVVDDFTVLPDDLIDPQFCPVAVQVTQNGSYAALLNNPRACNASGNPSIDVLDLDRELLVERVDGDPFAISVGGFHLRQSPNQDLLYYATEPPTRLAVEEATLPRPGARLGEDDELPTREVVRVDYGVRQRPLRDLGLVGGAGEVADARLTLLFNEGVVSVQDYLDDEPIAGALIDTPSDNRQLILDDTLGREGAPEAPILVLGGEQRGRFSYFPAPAEGADAVVDGESSQVAAVDAVVEPTYDFVYFLAAGQLSVFDLREYDPDDPIEITPFRIAALEDTTPSLITWVQAVPTE